MPLIQEVSDRRDRLNAAFDRISDVPDTSHQLRSDFARYLCVSVSGFVESSVNDIAIQYCTRHSNDQIQDYINRKLRIGNPTANRLLNFVEDFDQNWRAQLDAYITGERKNALDSVVSIRNDIAHGKSTGITYVGIKNYYRSAREVVEFINELFS